MNNGKTTKQDNRPSMQWYPDDWWAEVSLKLCSMAAQGLWCNMLNVMFMANPRGKLMANGKQIHGKELAKILGQDESDVERWLKELGENNVYSVDADGCIYCRRMKRHWEEQKELHDKRAVAGRLGAEKRWSLDGKDITKMAASTSSSTSTPTSSSTSKDILPNGNKELKVRKKRDPNVQLLWEYAVSRDFSMQGSERSNRRWIYNLLRKKDSAGVRLSVDILRQMIDMAVACRDIAYAPQINDFRALYYKFQDLYAFMQKQKSGGRIG